MKKSLLALAIGALAFVSSPSANAAEILLVSDQAFAAGDTRTGNPEDPFVSFLQSLGHTVVLPTGSGGTAQFRGDGGPAAAQSIIDAQGIDLVIVSRVTDSGQYSEGTTVPEGARRTAWNSIDVPLMIMGAHLARDNRWRWAGTQTLDETSATDLVFTDPNHPFVAGLGTNLLDSGTNRSVTRLGVASVGNGSIIATFPDTDAAIVEWEAGEEFYTGSGQFAGAKRVLFPGIRYHENISGDPVEFEDFSDNGKAILGQTINALVVPEPGTLSVLALGVVTLLRRRRA